MKIVIWTDKNLIVKTLASGGRTADGGGRTRASSSAGILGRAQVAARVAGQGADIRERARAGERAASVVAQAASAGAQANSTGARVGSGQPRQCAGNRGRFTGSSFQTGFQKKMEAKIKLAVLSLRFFSWEPTESWHTGMLASGYMSISGTQAPWSSPRVLSSSALSKPPFRSNSFTLLASSGAPGAGYCSWNSYMKCSH
ncbi:hypothetical protein M5K25_011563 [Dendrobium thyrsiflorum]|uniref:Uncharacterized protein n=1 Tax=Dendrobium thyrsiflorum TaxID=117978 RepID=A0ABD0VAR0_DENTH